MSLLSPGQFDQFRQAIKGVTDTFFQIPVTVVIRTATLSAFNQGRDTTSASQEITLNGLKIYDTTEGGAEVTPTKSGVADLSEGYVLFNYQDAEAAGLTDLDKNIKIAAGRDSLKMFGRQFEIEGVNLSGPLADSYALVKIHFKVKLL